MHLIGPFAALDCRLARRGRKDAWHRRAASPQMAHEAVLFEQPFAVAHRSVMALDEHALAARGHDACGGKRPRTHRKNLNRLSATGKLAEQRAHFGERERRPIGFDQSAFHSMRLCYRAHCLCILQLHPQR
jgi:hypothetical protein